MPTPWRLRRESWTENMVSLLILAREHSGPVDFAIFEVERHVAAISKLYYQLHKEVHHGGRKPEPITTGDDESNVVPLH
jgi:hypothetical protein